MSARKQDNAPSKTDACTSYLEVCNMFPIIYYTLMQCTDIKNKDYAIFIPVLVAIVAKNILQNKNSKIIK